MMTIAIRLFAGFGACVIAGTVEKIDGKDDWQMSSLASLMQPKQYAAEYVVALR